MTLNIELTVLLYQNGYLPEWDEAVFEKVMEQSQKML
jgi:type I restriction enzyme R subunit